MIAQGPEFGGVGRLGRFLSSHADMAKRQRNSAGSPRRAAERERVSEASPPRQFLVLATAAGATGSEHAQVGSRVISDLQLDKFPAATVSHRGIRNDVDTVARPLE